MKKKQSRCCNEIAEGLRIKKKTIKQRTVKIIIGNEY